MEGWLIALISVAATSAAGYLGQLCVKNIIRSRKDNTRKLDNLTIAVQSILRTQLEDRAMVYIHRGSITPREGKLWFQDYQVYHNLGANGVMDSIKKEIENLKWEEDK